MIFQTEQQSVPEYGNSSVFIQYHVAKSNQASITIFHCIWFCSARMLMSITPFKWLYLSVCNQLIWPTHDNRSTSSLPFFFLLPFSSRGIHTKQIYRIPMRDLICCGFSPISQQILSFVCTGTTSSLPKCGRSPWKSHAFTMNIYTSMNRLKYLIQCIYMKNR